jgi:tetratricopeptide (TPR) repeat protein
MLALYRSGRQAEALQVYREARTTMIEELGIEPNEQLQQLEYAILTSDDSLNAPVQNAKVTLTPPAAAAPGVPSLLPTDIADFTGRLKQIDEIRQQLLGSADDRPRLAVPVVVVVGKPGVGKTTIAVHVSHLIADRYPDGQLFADLHSGALRPLSPMQVLERFLRALGVPGTAIPDGLEERAEMYRALLADRRVLVVLDNAGSESQVQPLLPGNPASAVIITSRGRLGGLAGAVHVEVEVFDSAQSIELLSHIAGAERVQSDLESAATLARLCGRLPLALRIAGARLSARQHWSIEQLVGRLDDETRRLDELKHGDMAIRASISLTYESTGEAARRLFRLLAVLDTQLFSGWVAAALLDVPFIEAQDLLDDLADAQLIETTGVGYGLHSQYRFHDLIRVFARERLAAEQSADEQDAALRRVLECLLFLAEEAHRREYGGDTQIHSDAPRRPLPAALVDKLIDNPLAWYERERTAIVSGVRRAAQAGFTDICWDLAIRAVTLFETRVYLDEWRETHEIALNATRRAGDVRGQAAMLYSIGSLHVNEQRFDDASQNFEEALTLFEKVGDDQGAALVIRYIAFLERMSGRFDEAAAHYERALATFRVTGDHVASAYVLHNLAHIRIGRGDFDGAHRLLSEALKLSRGRGNRRVEAQVLHRMGETSLHRDDPRDAAEMFQRALTVVRDMGDPTGETYALTGLGVARLRLGETAEAESALQHALMLATTTGERMAEGRALLGLGELALTSGDAEQAMTRLEAALGLFREIRTPVFAAQALALLRDAHTAAGDDSAAAAMAAEAERVRAALRISD